MSTPHSPTVDALTAVIAARIAAELAAVHAAESVARIRAKGARK